MIFLTYILTYANNKPKAFKDDKNVKIVKKCDYFDFDCYASEISFQKGNGKTQYIKLVSEISNTTQKISNVTVKYEIHNNWTSKGDYTSDSDHKFNSGNDIPKTTTTTFQSATASINLTNPYPIKVLPLVRVKNPTVYAKVTYTRKLPDSMAGEGKTVTESVYFSFTYSKYVDGRTTING